MLQGNCLICLFMPGHCGDWEVIQPRDGTISGRVKDPSLKAACCAYSTFTCSRYLACNIEEQLINARVHIDSAMVHEMSTGP